MKPVDDALTRIDRMWEIKQLEENELKFRKDREMKKLTIEQRAFLEAYDNAVANAPRDEVIRFLTVTSEERSSRAFYDSMSDIYTSIFDAWEVWNQALKFARADKGMTVGKLSAALANLPQDLPVLIWDAGDRVGLAYVDDSLIDDEDYPRVEFNTDRDD
jgi:hypothetical protein